MLGEEEDRRDGDDVDRADGEAVAERLPHAVVEMRAEILADHRADRAGEGEEAAEGDRHQPRDDRPAGDRRVAIGRDRRGHVGVADRGGDVGEDRRHADLRERPEVAAHGGERRPGDQVVAADEGREAVGDHADPGDGRGDRRAGDAEAEARG